MRNPMLAPFDRAEFDAHELMTKFPPVWTNANKKLVAAISCPPGCEHSGRVGVTRWKAQPVPANFSAGDFKTTIRFEAGYFKYVPATSASTVTWYLNFADPHLFAFSAGGLFAQDEMQVTEHPVLAAVRDAMSDSGMLPLTVENKVPTPVLVTGAERRCEVATEPNAAEGRPVGLYGNRFAAGAPDAIRRATRAIVPPTKSNIIAIAALPGGDGEYTASEIEYILRTAVSGFSAACIESERLNPSLSAVVIHTGHWGCGAFGGNRELTALLQFLAANLSGVQELVFCYGEQSGVASIEAAQRAMRELVSKENTVNGLISAVAKRRYQWGVGDGN